MPRIRNRTLTFKVTLEQWKGKTIPQIEQAMRQAISKAMMDEGVPAEHTAIRISLLKSETNYGADNE
jgi:hypothetical protein